MMKLTKSQLKEMIREEMKSLDETTPMGRMDKNKFAKHMDLVLKTAGTKPGEIFNSLKKFGIEGREAKITATVLAKAVEKMTGGGE